jgi:hypothetical protein
MSEDSIVALFYKEVRYAPSSAANEMARGLCAYLLAFKALRDSAMNYETQPEHMTHSFIMQVPQDQLWPYTPHFRKLVVLAIQELFSDQDCLYGILCSDHGTESHLCGDHRNRWIMRMEESEFDTTMNQIIMYFPRSNTPLACKVETTPIEHLIDTTYLREKGLDIITTDVGSWFLG